MTVTEKILSFFGLEFEDEKSDIENVNQTETDEREEVSKKAKKAQEERRQEISHSVSPKGDLFLVEPTKISDAKIVCDELREAKTVVVNVKNISVEETSRLLDFIQGSVYALDGKIKRISEEVIVVAPKGIDIQTNQVDLDQDYVGEAYEEDDELEYGY